MAVQTEIIIPDLGLYSHYPKEAIPRGTGQDGFQHIGLSYCRNISLARKEGCISKSKGVKVFTASATGATDSVRGIGILNKHARIGYYSPSTTLKTVPTDADDGHDDGTTYTNNATYVRMGDVAATNYDGIFRFTGWTIAQTTQITSAVLIMKQHAGIGTGTLKLKVYGDDQSNPGQISDHADYAGRTDTTAYITKEIDNPSTTKQIEIDVTDIIQELVNSYAYTNEAIQLFVKDNGSDESNYWDASRTRAKLQITTADPGSETSPTFFMFVKGATAGELWKLDGSLVPQEVTKSGESYADSYQHQIGKFIQFGNDMIFSDDGFNDALQQWDVSDNPTLFEDVVANYNGRFPVEFKARLWLIYSLISGTIRKQRAYYSAVNDQTSFSDYALLHGYDAPTAAILLTEDELIIFKEGSCVRIVDRQTSASDYQPYVVSPRDGSLGANVVSDGARIYGRNDRGVFQFPVAGYPNGFRYIHKPIQDEIDKVPLTRMGLVYFAYNPGSNQVLMHYPDTGEAENTLCAVFNITKDVWENISDLWNANVMVDGYNLEGNPRMFFGQEDGHIKYIGGDDNEGSNFTGRLDTGALWHRDKLNRLISRRLLAIEPVTNYQGSYTLNFYYKVYDRPGDESTAAWNGPYTHAASIGNEEFVPILPTLEGKFHIIRIDGTLKDEPFEILGMKLKWELGHPT